MTRILDLQNLEPVDMDRSFLQLTGLDSTDSIFCCGSNSTDSVCACGPAGELLVF